MPRILVVEDDDALAKSLEDYLKGEGFALERVSTAAAARAAPLASFDVIILDWMLPDAPGIDLLHEWSGQGPPVLLLTARADLVDRVVGLELGAADYMTKPFEPRELLARLRVQLRQRRRKFR